jgi:hypothetical protein
LFPKACKLLGLDAPLKLGVPPKSSRTGAGGIDEYTIEGLAKGERARGVENEAGANRRNLENSFFADVACDGECERRFERLKGFVPGSGAEIQKRMARLEIE